MQIGIIVMIAQQLEYLLANAVVIEKSGKIAGVEEFLDHLSDAHKEPMGALLGQLEKLGCTYLDLGELRALKERRDYLVHRFFRVEVHSLPRDLEGIMKDDRLSGDIERFRAATEDTHARIQRHFENMGYSSFDGSQISVGDVVVFTEAVEKIILFKKSKKKKKVS